ncbi:uncharacterized protein LOC143904138 isoform X1 [Temnothorax americanus]|uniref:uncharacterized protein LOC143904138 isoform X1 n=1 Tax=Temnothorax americanus TaxID=1964332 RepID=UPI0040690FB3
MGVPDVEQAKKRLQDILRRAQKLEIPTQEVISTRTARKLLARTRNVLAWTIWIGVFVVLLSGVVYARWPTRQDVETVRTVLRRTRAADRDVDKRPESPAGLLEVLNFHGNGIKTARFPALSRRRCSRHVPLTFTHIRVRVCVNTRRSVSFPFREAFDSVDYSTCFSSQKRKEKNPAALNAE